mmetsp:Transcript_12820/g.27048  ORF Transcript_12820/g.27048 Transcript_12820/m.27048 type:complete len:256 (+) Transcript_12820:128-895(+)
MQARSSHGHPLARAHCNTSNLPSDAAAQQVSPSHGHPFARAHFNNSKSPSAAAAQQVRASHGHPLARAHCNVSKFNSKSSPDAAASHVNSSHGQPFVRAHCKVSKCPPPAANSHVPSSHGHGGFCERAHCRISRCPPPAAALHVCLLHGHPMSRAHKKKTRPWFIASGTLNLLSIVFANALFLFVLVCKTSFMVFEVHFSTCRSIESKCTLSVSKISFISNMEWRSTIFRTPAPCRHDPLLESATVPTSSIKLTS